MSTQWEHQVRIHLGYEFAKMARCDPHNSAIKPLADILRRHHATMKCQFDAFAGYVAEAETHSTENYPLYEWIKATIKTMKKRKNTPNPLRFMSTAMRSTPRRMPTPLSQTYSPW